MMVLLRTSKARQAARRAAAAKRSGWNLLRRAVSKTTETASESPEGVSEDAGVATEQWRKELAALVNAHRPDSLVRLWQDDPPAALSMSPKAWLIQQWQEILQYFEDRSSKKSPPRDPKKPS